MTDTCARASDRGGCASFSAHEGSRPCCPTDHSLPSSRRSMRAGQRLVVAARRMRPTLGRRLCGSRCAPQPHAARLHRLGHRPDRLGNRVKELIFRPRVGELTINTVLLEALHHPLTIVLAVDARLADGADRPARCARIWAWLAVAPLAVPAFVHSYAWISLFPGLHGLPGGVLRLRACLFPVSLSAGRRATSPSRPGDRGCGSLARPRAVAGLLPRHPAAAAAGDLRRLAARSGCICWPNTAST